MFEQLMENRARPRYSSGYSKIGILYISSSSPGNIWVSPGFAQAITPNVLQMCASVVSFVFRISLGSAYLYITVIICLSIAVAGLEGLRSFPSSVQHLLIIECV